jgi:hypothetical protein
MRMAIVVVLALVACGEPARQVPLDALMFAQRDARRTVLDDENAREWAIVVGATRVEVTRIRLSEAPGDADRMEELGPPRELAIAHAARLQEILAKPRFSLQKLMCAIEPGVRVRFHRGEESADLLVCFRCGMLALTRGGGDWASRHWFDFGYERADLVGWARTVFPDEPAFFEPIRRL